MSMFPHTVTIYNVSQETDPATFKDVEKTYITVLRGVLLEASSGQRPPERAEGADAVNLYIPFSTVAVDGVTGAEKRYVGRKNSGVQLIKAESGRSPRTATAERHSLSRVKSWSRTRPSRRLKCSMTTFTRSQRSI